MEHVSYALPGPEDNTREVFLKNIHFRLTPGEVLLVAGPSASGKSTLARLLVGLSALRSGKVRFNGVDAHRWPKDELGQHIGYLPQNIELLDGTLAENIARFGDIDEQQLATVIDLLDLHAFVASLPDGLQTRIGAEGAFLSGGRRQLVGLARAVYGNPRIVILDEPNANLDQAGEMALAAAVRELKERGTTLMIVGHRPSTLAQVDKVLFLKDGRVELFGSREDVLGRLRLAAGESARVAPPARETGAAGQRLEDAPADQRA